MVSPHICDFIAELPKGPGTSCPDSPVAELLKYLATLNAQVDKSNPEVNLRLARDLIRPIFELERLCMLKAFRSTNPSENELKFFKLSIPLSCTIDQLYLAWYEHLVIPHLKLTADWNEEDKKAHADHLREILGGQYDYTCFLYDHETGQVLDRKTWAEAFPEIVEKIRDQLDFMALYCEDDTTPNYFLALADAFGCTEISQLEARWAAVDQAWIKIPPTCTMVPVHGMENYEHPVGVSPEFRLAVRTDIGSQIIEHVREAVLIHAKASNFDHDLIKLAERKLRETMDIAVFTDALRGGTCLRIRISGQVVPNRQDILVKGGKNFLNPEGIGTTVGRSHDLLRRFCTPQTAATLIPLVTFEAVLADVVSHECTHPTGCTPKVEEVLGNRSSLEEGKATIGGLAAICAVESDQARRSLAISTARVCRFLLKARRAEDDSQDYVRENMIMAGLLFNSGAMRLTETGLEVDPNNTANVDNWIDMMNDFYYRVVQAYHADNPRTAVAELEQIFCRPNNPNILALIVWLDREQPTEV
ncbi:TPA: hypothetical protein DEA21_04815 [Candidatus Uhrbacteria bacterium]|nr:hypothetical protein [Candidatus Uhrbacteria bacterium]HCU32068.1 hypothetical protein [Candidatus Uhrbacteria bacterium]